MNNKLFSALLIGLFLSGCALRPNQPQNILTTSSALRPTATVTPPPTNTPVPTATATSMPTPDLSSIGLPAEPAGTLAFDFADQMCAAQWFTRGDALPCPGNTDQGDAGYVIRLNAGDQGLPPGFNLMLTYPPQDGYDTISSKYPAFTVQKGDRFRAVLACRAHSFCDVEFFLSYFDGQRKTGLTHWRYIFADPPLVVDYPLAGLAGVSAQFDLEVQAKGNRADANAVWIAPHIYRPIN